MDADDISEINSEDYSLEIIVDEVRTAPKSTSNVASNHDVVDPLQCSDSDLVLKTAKTEDELPNNAIELSCKFSNVSIGPLSRFSSDSLETPPELQDDPLKPSPEFSDNSTESSRSFSSDKAVTCSDLFLSEICVGTVGDIVNFVVEELTEDGNGSASGSGDVSRQIQKPFQRSTWHCPIHDVLIKSFQFKSDSSQDKRSTTAETEFPDNLRRCGQHVHRKSERLRVKSISCKRPSNSFCTCTKT